MPLLFWYILCKSKKKQLCTSIFVRTLCRLSLGLLLSDLASNSPMDGGWQGGS